MDAQSFHNSINSKSNNAYSLLIDAESTYKNYERFSSYKLETCESPLQHLGTLLQNRSSMKFESTPNKVTVRHISSLLYHAASRTDKKPYASGGSKYPVNLYLAAQSVTGLFDNIYYYHPKKHSLFAISNTSGSDTIFDSLHYPWPKSIPVLLVLTLDWRRTTNKYGDLGYQLAMFESGLLSQNLQLVSAAIKLQSCIIRGFNSKTVSDALGLISEEESPLLTIAIS